MSGTQIFNSGRTLCTILELLVPKVKTFFTHSLNSRITHAKIFKNLNLYLAGRVMPSVGPLGHATRIIAGVWCLVSIVFVYLYNGCLTSYITFPKMRPIIESLDQLANSAELELAILKNSVFESIILVFSIYCNIQNSRY